MKRRELIWFSLIFLGLCGLAAVLYLIARPDEPTVNYKPALSEGVFAVLEGPSRVTSIKGGRLAWTLEDQGLVFYRDRGEVDVHSPRALIPVAEGGTVEVTGAFGFYEQDTEDISLHGGVDIRMQKAGRDEWRMASENAYYRSRAQAFELDDLTGKISPANGDTVAISGERGRYDIQRKHMTLDQDVRCRFQDGIDLTTDHLTYDVATETAATDSEVLVEGKGFRMLSTGITANLKTRQVVAPANVRLRMDPKKAKP